MTPEYHRVAPYWWRVDTILVTIDGMPPQHSHRVTVDRTSIIVERTVIETPHKRTTAAAHASPLVTAETITDDQLRALRDEAIASGDDGTRNLACGALGAVDAFQGLACRQACAALVNAKRVTEGA